MKTKNFDFKMEKGNYLTIFEYLGIILNIMALFALGMCLVYLFFHAPENKWLGNAVGIGLTLTMLYHAFKVIQIFRKKMTAKGLDYLSNYVNFVIALSFLLSFFSFATVFPFLTQLKWFFIFISVLISNIFLLVKLSNKENSLSGR